MSWSVVQPFADFAGFVLVANHTSIPTSLASGVPLFTWSPQRGQAAGDYEAWISLDEVHRNRWTVFYCKLMVKDPAQTPNTLVVHPDVTVPVSDSGEFLTSKPPAGLRTFKAGVPKTVICPYCFQEFGVEEMLFTSFSGGDHVHANYGWLHRVLRRPLRPPVNDKGQRLTRKLCPNSHELPYTAGDQSSLVIGVIGGKYAGKSTYIASLIERLQGRVCGDFQAALLPVSDEGQKRYEEEFYKPQFVNKREVPVTVGSPPPLIYELTMDGRLFGEKSNRSVTLALYDTAGENLKNPDEVRRTVQYLKVASGVMFLIDPLQVPSVRQKVPSSLRLPNQDQAALPQNIISNVMTELQAANVVGDEGRLEIPVAVVLTKCDVLRDAGLIETNRLWCDDTRHVAYFDEEIHADTAGMLGEYIQLWTEGAYNIVRQKFSRFAFFGASATGCASDKETGRYRFVSPWRVEDPLLWLLAELGVIRTRKGGK
jgi:GTPase SAR1 family protein